MDKVIKQYLFIRVSYKVEKLPILKYDPKWGPQGSIPISGSKEAKNGHWYKTKVVYQGGLNSRKIVNYNILPKMGLPGVTQF